MHNRRFRRSGKCFLTGLGLLIAPTTTAFAVDHSWQNPANGSWSVAGNWNPASIPGTNDNVFLNQPAAYTITLNSSPVANNVNVSGGTVTFLSGPLVSGGIATVDGGGRALLNGAGWRNESDDFIVGNAGSGMVNVSGGGSLTFGDYQVGVGTGSSGQLLFSGPGTVGGSVNVVNDGTLGEAGAATLNVTNGARLNNSGVLAADQTSAAAFAMVSGANSLWQIGMNSSSLTLGESGIATLQVLNGGRVRISNVAGDGTTLTPVQENQFIVGGQPVGTGVVLIDGANSQLYVGDTAEVGDLGTGSLTVQNGGLFQLGQQFSIGVHTLASGVVSVTGTGSQIQVGSHLFVGRDQGVATLNITGGGLVTSTNTDSRIGWFTSLGRGNVFVDGLGSAWNSQDLYVADAGHASVTISNGGAISSSNVIVGAQGGSTGIATLTGASGATPATWNVTGSLTLGGTVGADGGDGTLVLNPGGQVNVGTIKLWNSGTLILNGGTINAGSIQLNSSSSTVNFQSGTFRYTGNRTLNSLALTNVLGATPTILAGRHLAVAGTATLSNALTLNGGSFSVGTIGSISNLTFTSGTFNLTSQNLTIGAGGLFGNSLTLATGKAVNVTNTATITGGSTLTLNGGAFGAGVFINSGTAALTGGSLILGTATNSATINNSGGYVGWSTGVNQGTIVTSGGTVNSGTATNNAFISMISGATLLTNGGLRNLGSLSINASTMSGPVNNVASLTVSNGTVITGAGLTNSGSANLTSSTVNGPVTNTASMTISSGSVITGTGMTNGGSINVTSSTINGPVNNSGSALLSNSTLITGSGLINGGSMSLTGSTLNGSVTNNSSMSISNGTVITGASFSNVGSMNVSGSTMSGAFTNSGSLVVSNSTVTTGSGMINGGSMTLGGSTTLNGPVTNNAYLLVTHGTVITGNSFSNVGSMNLEVSNMSGSFTNSGSLLVTNSTVSTGSGMVNGGSMSLGGSTLNGPITNNGSLTISNGTVITGTGLTNSGSMSLSSSTVSGPVANNKTIAIAGDVNLIGPVTGGGSFLGGGTAHFGGGLSPGAGPATTSFAGNVSFETGNTLNIKLGGHTPGTQHDRLSIGGDLEAGGNLAVTLFNGLAPTPGESFDVIDFGTHGSGDFNIIDDPARPGLVFTTEYTASLMRLVTTAKFAGDANLDAKVDISDLLILANHWQQIGGSLWTTADFNDDGNVDNIDLGILAANWQAGVGAPGPGLSLPAATIPELAGLSSAAILLMMGSLKRRRRRIHAKSSR